MQSTENSGNQVLPSVAVTGAGGLVGSYLVKYLADKGYPVRAIVRSAGRPEHLIACIENAQRAKKDVQLKLGDVNDADSLKDIFKECRIVVHAAGSVDPYGSREAIFKTNVEGTKTALSAARTAGCQQFIHLSSLSVITGQGDQFDVDESAPLRYCGENYADSKVAAEEALDIEIKTGGIKITIVRPGFIYGPYEKTWMPRLIESIRTGKAALIDGGNKETNVINVENLCRAIEGAMNNEAAFGEKYNLTDGQKISKKMLFDTMSESLKLPRVSRVVPSAVAKPFFNLVSVVAPMLAVDAQRKLARYSRAAYRLVGVNQGFSVAKAERQLGYTDRVPFQQGMRDALSTFAAGPSSGTDAGSVAGLAGAGNKSQ
jgi:nucleoside-diphosphate-sugar epimerase